MQARAKPHRVSSPRASLVVVALGLLITAALAIGAGISYHHNQRRLASLQTSLTASALSAEPTVFANELGEIAGVTANSRDPAKAFRGLVGPIMQPRGPFASAALVELKAG